MSNLIPLVPYVIHQIANPVTTALMSVEFLKSQHLVKDEALAPALASLEEVRRWLWVWRHLSANSASPSLATWINLPDELRSILFFLDKSTLGVDFQTTLDSKTAFCFASAQEYQVLIEGCIVLLHRFSPTISVSATVIDTFFRILLTTASSPKRTPSLPHSDRLAHTPKAQSCRQLQRLAKRSLSAKITTRPHSFQIDIPVI